MSGRILLVDPDPVSAAAVEQMLIQAGHRVTHAASFEEALSQASHGRPDLLITAVRLGPYNGLHLAVRFRADYPGRPVIAIGTRGDAGMAAEARQLGAQFVPQSTPGEQLREIVEALLAGRSPTDLERTRHWFRRPSALPAQVATRPAHVVDVGYGGMRLQFAAPPTTGERLDIELPTLGLVVQGVFRWSKPVANSPAWWCGVELDASNVAWRRTVESLRTAAAPRD
ncbi:MAG: response regulator [Vicinamibacterales bacterium]